jgi:hypothetical protein
MIGHTGRSDSRKVPTSDARLTLGRRCSATGDLSPRGNQPIRLARVITEWSAVEFPKDSYGPRIAYRRN